MAKKKAKTYTVSDGQMLLQLEDAGDGWWCVTAPMEPGVVTQARSIPEAFEMARDAAQALHEVRRRMIAEAKTACKAG